VSSSTLPSELLRQIDALSRRQQLKLVERVLHNLTGPDVSEDPTAIIGCMADQAELLDEIVGGAMASRRRLPLRRPGA
jgi:hypothetical protein